ncbi:hypothetical protein DAEQUDRAFT_363002 [Daedalea quercina L-15889]|uniref:Uncharacterized protein n=1 Tax=Daedalea quercina L-15889 TaxID=1314783 RepID=A0A165TU18_9APHY|nr:hypothetical protein DAEQUDRAFT_363002 [Daedalea quercina L-15889]
MPMNVRRGASLGCALPLSLRSLGTSPRLKGTPVQRALGSRNAAPAIRWPVTVGCVSRANDVMPCDLLVFISVVGKESVGHREHSMGRDRVGCTQHSAGGSRWCWLGSFVGQPPCRGGEPLVWWMNGGIAR